MSFPPYQLLRFLIEGKFLYRKEYQPPQAADYTRTAKLTKRLE